MISGVTSADVENSKLSSSFSSVIVDIIQDNLKTITILTIQKMTDPTTFLLTYSVTTINLTVNEIIKDIEKQALSTSSSSLFTTQFTKDGYPNAKVSRIFLISSNIESNTGNTPTLSPNNELSSTTASSEAGLSTVSFGAIRAIIGSIVLVFLLGSGVLLYRNHCGKEGGNVRGGNEITIIIPDVNENNTTSNNQTKERSARIGSTRVEFNNIYPADPNETIQGYRPRSVRL